MAKNNYDLDDNLDDLFAELDDINFDENPEAAELSSREAVSAIATGALESLKDKDTLKSVGKNIVRKALPSGYKAGLDAADDALASANDLYDKVLKPLEAPVRDLKKLINKKVDDLPDFIDEELRERIREMTTVEELPGAKSYDPDQTALDMAMSAVFELEQGQKEQFRKQAELTMATTKVNANLKKVDTSFLANIAGSTQRLAEYQDGIQYRYQQRSLELQHLQYFATRDILAVFRAFAEDNKSQLDGIVHNTSIPDFMKSTLTEEYKEKATDRLFGRVQESVEKYTDNFTDRLKENVQTKAMGMAKDAAGILSGLLDAGATAGEVAGDIDDQTKYELAGGMATEMVLSKLSPAIGNKIRKMLKDVPDAERTSKRLTYIAENFPSFFNSTLKNWDGQVFPESVTDKFPFLSEVNASILKQSMLEAAPKAVRQDLEIAQTLKDTATEAVPWDVISRRTLIEIIPGYLSRMLQLQEQAVTGEQADRQVFSLDSESFTRLGDESKRVQDSIFGSVGRKRRKLTDALIKVLGAGSGVNLSSEAREGLSRLLTESALEGDLFSIDNIRNKSTGNERVDLEIAELIDNSRGQLEQRELSGSRIFRELVEGQGTAQERINQLYASGMSDILRDSGLLTTEYGETRVSEDKAYSLQFGKDAEEIHRFAEMMQEQQNLPRDRGAQSAPVNSNIAAQQRYEDLRKIFFDPFGKFEAIPVYTPGAEDKPEQENPIVPMMKEGFEGIIALLTAISEGVVTGQPQSDERIPGRIANGIYDFLQPGNIITSMGNFTKSYYQGLASFTTSLGTLASGAIGGTVDRVIGLGKALTDSDVYVKGRREPALRADLMKAGEYFDKETGKPIKSIKDVAGTVIDSDGNVVLSEADIEIGIFNARGVNLGGLLNLATKPFEAAINFQSGVFGLMTGTAKSVMGAINYVNEKVRDIYVVGENTPRLYAYILKNGGYFSKATQKRIFNGREIDGEVVDSEGNTVLSFEDIQKGLVDNIGTPVGGNRLMQMAKKLIGSNLKLVGRVVSGTIRGGIEAGNTIVRGAGSLLGYSADKLSGAVHIGNMENVNNVLTEIRDHMQERWPITGPSSVLDRDEDGDRDNSWRDILSREAEAASEEPLTKDAKVSDADKEEKSESKGEGLFGLMASAMGGIAGGVSTLIEVVSGIGTTLMSWFAYNKATDAATTASDLLDGGLDAGKGKGKKGFLGKMGKFAKNVGGKLMSGGGKILKGALSAGGTVLSVGSKVLPWALRAAGTAASAVAGSAAAPVIAAAGIAYTGYQAYSYISKRVATEPLEALRYLQYGFDPKNTDYLPLIRELESDVMDEITWSGNEPSFGLTVAEAIEEYAENWGVDIDDASQSHVWASWFAKRFMPVLMTHARAAHVIDKSIDILDVDDEMAQDKKAGFVRAVGLKSKFRGKQDPYAITASPIPGETLQTNEAAIRQTVENLLAKYTGKPNKPVKVEKDPAVDSHVSNASSAYAAAAEAKLMAEQSKKRNTVTTTTARDVKARKSQIAGIAALPKETPKASKKGISLLMPVEGRISSPYGVRVHPITGTRKMHKGVDIAAPEGTPIRASEDGIILRIYSSKSYGNVIYLRHANGMATRYAHMVRFAPGLHASSEVRKGQVIGYVGNTGASAGNHLHWELRETSDQWANTLDPLKYVEGNYASKLRKEERAIKSDEKAGNKETADKTLEGQDTLRSTLLNRPVPENNTSEPTSKAKADKERHTRTQSGTDSQRQAKLDKQLSDAMKANGKSTQEANNQRAKQLTEQEKTNKQLELMVAALEVIASQTANNNQPTKATAKPANRPTHLAPVVDMKS